jgi:peptide/nickel transport system permease protein
MIRYIGQRLLQGAFVLWAAYTVSFFILYLLPGDAVSIMASGDEQNAVDPALVAKLRSEYGLDRPLYEQYFIALGRALQLDFGISIKNGVAATQSVAEVLPETIKLAAAGFALAVLLGSALATAATFSRNPWVRQAIGSLPPLGIAVPTFWIGLLLLQLFSFRLRLFRRSATTAPPASSCPHSPSPSRRRPSSPSCCPAACARPSASPTLSRSAPRVPVKRSSTLDMPSGTPPSPP